ncbi:MAG: isochorismatase family protein [Bacteroidales bacterium]|nr:isochorismatase family protein [Bacteroidales bacterium]
MRINRENAAALIIDVQEKLFSHMDQKEALLKKISIFLEGMRVLGVPLVLTEQYPKGLGATVEALAARLDQEPLIEKISFSCCDEPAVMQTTAFKTSRTVIVGGIEAHVCVLQTVVDLLATGYAAVVVEDCISSRKPEDKRVAVERMRAEGAVITTCESLLFELARLAGTEEFKAISRLVK